MYHSRLPLLSCLLASLSIHCHAELIHNIYHLGIKADSALYNKTLLDLNENTVAGTVILDTVAPFVTTRTGLMSMEVFASYTTGTDAVNAGLGSVYRVITGDDSLYGYHASIQLSTSNTDIRTATINIGSELFSRYFDARANLYVPTGNKDQTYDGKEFRAMRGSSIEISRKIGINYASHITLNSMLYHFYDDQVDQPISASKIALTYANTVGRSKSVGVAVEIGNDNEIRASGHMSISLINLSSYIMTPINRTLLSAPSRITTAVWGLKSES